MSRLRVLQIGMNPDVIDFSPWPGQTADALRARIAAGFDLDVCLLTDLDSTDETITRYCSTTRYDAVTIGSGLRASHEYTVIFERTINTVIGLQPGVPLCFNDSPESTLDAVRRVLPNP